MMSVLAAGSRPLQVAFLSLQTRGGPKKGWTAENCVAFYTFQRSRSQPSGGAVGGRIDLWLLHHFEAPPCWQSPGWPTSVHRWAGPSQANRIYSRLTPLSEVAARFAAIGVNMTKATNPTFRERFGGGWIMGCKPLLGVLFADLLSENYSFWMYGDFDGLFGATRDLFTWPRLHDYDYVSGYSQEGRFDAAGHVRPACRRLVHASGPLQLFRNSEATRSFGHHVLAKVFRRDLEVGGGYGLEEYFGVAYHSSALLAAAANGSLSSIRRADIRHADIRRFLFNSEWLPRPPFRSPTASPACQAGRAHLGSDVLILNVWYPKGAPGSAARWLRNVVKQNQSFPSPIAISWSAARGLVVKRLTTSDEVDRLEQRLALADDESMSPLGAPNSTVYFLHFLWLKHSVARAGLQKCLGKIAQQLPHVHRIALLIRNATCKCYVTTALRGSPQMPPPPLRPPPSPPL